MRESAHSGVHTTLHIAECIKLKEQGFQFRHFLLLIGGVILGYLSFSIWKNKGSKDYLLRVQEGWGNLRDYLVWFLVQRRSSNPKSSSGPFPTEALQGAAFGEAPPAQVSTRFASQVLTCAGLPFAPLNSKTVSICLVQKGGHLQPSALTSNQIISLSMENQRKMYLLHPTHGTTPSPLPAKLE